ncbi:MAG: hypothetical protein Q8Q92_05015 [bacterium]|nr:hypothetical protein [bacterium]
MEKGNGTLEGVIILAVLLVIILAAPKGNSNPAANPFSPSISNVSNSNQENTAAPDSPYARNVSLGGGNATYVYQTYEEYVTIDNSGNDPVNITNWQLKNGKDKRAYDLGGTLRYFPRDSATIGQAVLFISPSGRNTFQNVVLKSGETAIITTGQVGSQLPYKIVSFKENTCSGYLEDLMEYDFTPPLTRRCLQPADEPGVNVLDIECRRFIERMSSCRTPKFDTRDRDGEICQGCVDGTPLSGSCVAFIKSHFNYNFCIANHANDPNFSGQTWRIFLGRGWEMWVSEYETIGLYDQLGRLVDYRNY